MRRYTFPLVIYLQLITLIHISDTYLRYFEIFANKLNGRQKVVVAHNRQQREQIDCREYVQKDSAM